MNKSTCLFAEHQSLTMPFLLSGNGTTGNQRNSFFGAYGGSEKIKDPRPLHDKAYIQQCIKQLCEVCSFSAESPMSSFT